MSVATLSAKHAVLRGVLTERSRRGWAATEARALGYGGIAVAARATGLQPSTISRGVAEIESPDPTLPAERVRRAGGGRKRATTHAPTQPHGLEALVEPSAPGDPDSPLRWTCLSTRTLAVALEALGHHVSHAVVAELLHGLGYSFRGNVMTPGRAPASGSRRAVPLHRTTGAHGPAPLAAGLSVDTKKKELVGPFNNGGRAWRPSRTPQRFRVHDFVIPGATGGRAIPYGVHDLHRDEAG